MTGAHVLLASELVPNAAAVRPGATGIVGAGFAADVPIVVLGASAVVLLACTALLSWTLPSIAWRWRWRSRPARSRSARPRVVTGRPPALPVGPVPAVVARRPLLPARQQVSAADVQRTDDGTSEVEEMIDQLLDTDPDRVAWLMMHWIRHDGRARRSR